MEKNNIARTIVVLVKKLPEPFAPNTVDEAPDPKAEPAVAPAPF
jgi:hypothetical protein